ncbi:hypothetical protein ACFQ1S_28455 [Kibdelosporangium lantanae]|uniref:Uncharacterized protein n=1 Tax=Kibdelosporangium lantanae TaxID=1497396 RepID=A0ABW3MF06_9PSEU
MGRLVQQTTFAGDTLVVLNRARPAEWELRTRGVLITSSKQFPLPLANRPLRCWELLSTPYCLLRLDGPPNESTYGLLSRVGATWTVVRGVVFSNRATVEVKDLGPATVALVAVEQVDDGRWHSVVMLWTEPSRRCSPLVATREQLPGWPDVRPGLQDLNPC